MRDRARTPIHVAAGVLAALAVLTSAASATTVRTAASPVVSHTSPRYVSFAVDLDQVTGGMFWSQAPHAVGNAPVAPYDFTRSRLRALARALAPAYLRISGTAANKTYYDLGATAVTTPPGHYQRVLTKAEWDNVGAFARALGLQIVLGINAGLGPREAAFNWTPDNARALLSYTAAHGFPLAAVEFGNEPNLFALSSIPPSYSAADYVRDLRTFDALRRGVVPHAQLLGPGSFYNNAGSETPYGAALGPLASQFMPAVPGIYDLLAFHEYPATSTRCPRIGTPVPKDPLDPAYLDGVIRAFNAVKTLGAADDPGRPIWYTEAGSASCGGQQDYSNRFEATFWYLNALGALAQRGLRVLIRQTLSGSDYGLIDDATLQPNPDYWAALLWHRLMGTAILRPRVNGAPARLRVYAACARGGHGTTLLALNLDPHAGHTFTLADGARRLDVYRVTARSLLGRQVLLNGHPLRTSSSGGPPALRPLRITGSAISLPPASYAFIVEPGAGSAACRR
jgi:heparanase 1